LRISLPRQLHQFTAEVQGIDSKPTNESEQKPKQNSEQKSKAFIVDEHQRLALLIECHQLYAKRRIDTFGLSAAEQSYIDMRRMINKLQARLARVTVLTGLALLVNALLTDRNFKSCVSMTGVTIAGLCVRSRAQQEKHYINRLEQSWLSDQLVNQLNNLLEKQ